MPDRASGTLSDVSADLVPDDLWERIAALLPTRPARRHRHPGRLPVSDRVALAGIMYVLRKGVAWRDVPIQVVGCSGVTAWRRLRDWTEAGVWPRLREVLLAELRAVGLLEMDDSAITARTSGRSKGGSHRTFAGRPGPAGQQAPPDRRPAWQPARRNADRRPPPRCHTAPAAPGRDPTDPGSARTPADTTAQTVRRPGLRLRQVPPPAVEAWDQASHCPSRRRPRFRPG